MHRNIEIGSKMFPLRIFLVLLILAIAPPVFAGEKMGGDMSNTIVADGKIIDKVIMKRDGVNGAYETKFVYSVAYKKRVYFCIVGNSGTSCTGTEKDQ